MLLSSIIFSLFFALFFALLLAYAFNRRGPGPANGLIFAFTIIFLFSWAIGGWLTPMGPVHWGTSWLGYLLLAIVITLLLGVLLPPEKQKDKLLNKSPASDEKLFQQNADKHPMELSVGIFFWLTVIALLGFAITKIFY